MTFPPIGPTERRYFSQDAIVPRNMSKDELHYVLVLSKQWAILQDAYAKLRELPPLPVLPGINPRTELLPPMCAREVAGLIEQTRDLAHVIETIPEREAEDEEDESWNP